MKGTFVQTDVDLPGDSATNQEAADMIGNGGQAFINEFAKQAIVGAVAGGVGGTIFDGLLEGLGVTAEEGGFVGYEAAALGRARSLGLTPTTTFNAGKGLINGETTGVTNHALLQAASRGVSASEISEALSQAPKGPYGSVFRFYGSTAQVRVNMISGKIVTVIPLTAR